MICLRPTDYNSDPVAAILRQIPRNRLQLSFLFPLFHLKNAFKVIFLHPEPYKHLLVIYIFFYLYNRWPGRRRALASLNFLFTNV